MSITREKWNAHEEQEKERERDRGTTKRTDGQAHLKRREIHEEDLPDRGATDAADS